MPRLPNVPSYCRHKASGQAVVTIAGVDRYLGFYGTKASRVEYDRVVAEWLASGRPSAPPKVNDLTVAELCLAYLRHAKAYYRKNGRQTKTLDTVKAALRRLNALYADTRAADFGPIGIKAIQAAMIREKVARSYINDITAWIRRVFKWAAAESLVPITVYQSITVVPGLKKGRTEARETDEVQPVDDATVNATLPFLPSVVADMVRLQRLTGMRPSEVCGLRPCDLERTGDVWSYTPSEHKTEHHGRSRVVALGAKAQEILRPYLLRDAESPCFSPAESERKRLTAAHENRKTPLSCGNRPGSNRCSTPKRTPRDRYDKDSYKRAIARAVKAAQAAARREAGLGEDADVAPQHWSPNRLRHSFATEVRGRFGLEAVQVTLGHASADVSQIYAQADFAKAAEVARQIG